MVTLDQEIINGFDCSDQDTFWSIFTEYRSAIRIGKNKEGLEVHLAATNSKTKKDHKDFLNAVGCADTFCFDSIIRLHSDFLYDNRLKKQERKLRDKLVKFGNARTEHPSLFLADITEPTHIDLIVQNPGFKDYSKTVKHFLQFNDWKAILSTAKNEPNYIIQIPQLVERIEDLLGEKLDLGYFPRTIEGYVEGFDRHRTLFSCNDVYSLAITQKNGCAFTFNSEMGELSEKITQGLTNDLEKGRAIFDWMKHNITYDDKQRKHIEKKDSRVYRGALQVFQDGKGVCGEQEFLYVALCRLSGLKAYYALVPKEEVFRFGSLKEMPQLDHACTALFLPGNRMILVDTTNQNGFDIKYQKFQICSDESTCVGHHES